MNDAKEKSIALAVIKQLKGLSYYEASQILIWVSTQLKKQTRVK
jgi:hypothetical protein